jgi:aminoglycoside phosphotransferase (APT) family kinase protein
LISIESVSRELGKTLEGQRIAVSCVHGDFSAGNIRATPDGGRVTGIVDWENSAPQDLPMLDIVNLMLSIRIVRERCELGHILRTWLTGGGLTAEELQLLEMSQSSLGGHLLGFHDLVVLAWLRHVADNLARSSQLEKHRWWVSQNVERVLSAV